MPESDEKLHTINIPQYGRVKNHIIIELYDSLRERNEVDKDWIILITQAKQQGLTKKEVADFLKKGKRDKKIS